MPLSDLSIFQEGGLALGSHKVATTKSSGPAAEGTDSACMNTSPCLTAAQRHSCPRVLGRAQRWALGAQMSLARQQKRIQCS